MLLLQYDFLFIREIIEFITGYIEDFKRIFLFDIKHRIDGMNNIIGQEVIYHLLCRYGVEYMKHPPFLRMETNLLGVH